MSDIREAPALIRSVSPELLAHAERLEGHPRFSEAMARFSLCVMRLYQAPGVIRFLVNETARILIAHLCLALDALADPDIPDSGLTLGRLQEACATLSLASRGRVHALVKMMEVAGYLHEAPSRDRRVRRLAPSDKLRAYSDDLALSLLEGADLLLPAPFCAARYRDPAIRQRFIRTVGSDMLAGFVPWDHFADIRLFTSRNGGSHILMVLLEAAGTFRGEIADEPVVPLSLAELSRGHGLSRSHLRQLLLEGEAQGLFRIGTGKGYEVTLTRRLIHTYRLQVALFLAYFIETAERRV